VTPYGTPDAPTNVTIKNNAGYAPTTVTLAWTASANTGDVAGVTYRISYDGGGEVTASSGQTYSAGVGNHSFTIYAVNGGGKRSGTVSSNTIYVSPQPLPSPSVVLAADPTPQSGQGGPCTGRCHKYDITLVDFPSGSHTIQYFCQAAFKPDQITTQTHIISGKICGWPDTYVIVDGVASNHVNFNF